MTEERIKEIERAFGVLDPAKFPLCLHNLIRTVAAESWKEGIDAMLKAAKRRDPWKTGLDEEAEWLKEQR